MSCQTSRVFSAERVGFIRSNPRFVILLLVFLFAACGDEQVGPEMEPTARLSLSVVLPEGSTGLVPVSSVHLTLTSAARTAVDTLIQAAPIQDTIKVVLDVRLSMETESFAAAIELMNAAGSIVFSGQLGALTLKSSVTTPQTANLPVSYVGVGAGASQVEITSTDSILASGDTLTFDAVARDGAGNPIMGTPIRWKSTDASRAMFLPQAPGKLVAGTQRGLVSVVAALLTGPADTASVLVVPAAPSLIGEALDSLEAALFIAVTQLIDPGPFEVNKLDLFSFLPAKTLFEQALAVDPANQTAMFGLAVCTILSLEDDPGLRAAADGWDLWLQTNDDLHDLTTGTGNFPPTLAEQQDLLRDVVQPALLAALDLFDRVDDPAFVFTVTARMQGKSPGAVGPRELDHTDVLAIRSGIGAAIAGLDIALSVQTTPSPYGPAGFDAAFATGSTFGSLAADGSMRRADARDRLLESVALAREALDSLQAETDDQTDDVVKYDPAAGSGYDNLDDVLGPVDVQNARDFLADVEATLQGPATLTTTSGLGEVLEFLKMNLVVDMSQFFLNPVSDLKTLLPQYQTANGEFHWTALAFDEWVFPDPTLGGVLPNISSSSELKDAIDLAGAYDELSFLIDEWIYFTQSPVDGDLFAITELGDVHEISADLLTGTDRPDVTPGPGGFAGIIRNVATAELVVLTKFDGLLYTRPDDAVSAWTERSNIGCCWSVLTQSPVAASMFAVQGGAPFPSLEIASDFSSTEQRPPTGLDLPASLIGNSQTGELVALDYDGDIISRPADATSPWVQRPSLPFTFFDSYVGITEAPAGGDMLAVTREGVLYRISSDFSSSVPRPSVPASEVAYLISNTQTGELLALTPDGRVFSRPDDASTPWTKRFTLPRTILP